MTTPPIVDMLSDQAKTDIAALCTACLKEEQAAFRTQVQNAAQLRFYVKGIQYISWDATSYVFRSIEDSDEEIPEYYDSYNIMQPHKRSLASVLTQNTPGTNFIPNDLSQPTDVQAAEASEKMRHRLYRDINAKAVQNQAAERFCTDGRVIAWTRTDAEGKATCSLFGVLESKVPVFAEKDDWTYTILFKDRDKYAARDEYYPGDKDKQAQIVSESSDGDGSYARYARMGVLGTGTSESSINVVTETHFFCTKARYLKLPDASRAEVASFYPDGLHATIISGKVVVCESAKLKEELSVAYCSPGDGQNRPALLTDLVPLQDAFNDGMNMVREYFDYGVPPTWFRQGTITGPNVEDQVAAPATYHMANGGTGALSDSFWQEAPAVLPQGLIEYLQNIQGQLSQFISGDLPSLYGGSMEDVNTARGYSMAREQAMGGMSVPWASMMQFHADISQQGVQSLAQFWAESTLSIQDDSGSISSFEVADILAGNAHCYPDQDSSFPETTAAKRTALQAFVKQVADMGGDEADTILMDPDNLKLILQMSGLEDFQIPQATARDQAQRRIKDALKQPPDNWDDNQAGMTLDPNVPRGTPPAPMASSIKLRPSDYIEAEEAVVKKWLSSVAREDQERSGNLAGVQNVQLYWQALSDQISQNQQSADQANMQKQQALEAAKHPPAQPKPIAVSANLKDLPPETQAVELKLSGLPSDPAALAEHQGMNQALEVGKDIIKAHDKPEAYPKAASPVQDAPKQEKPSAGE